MAKAKSSLEIHCHKCGCLCEIANTFCIRTEDPNFAPIDLCKNCFLDYREASSDHKLRHGKEPQTVELAHTFLANFRDRCKYHDKYREQTRAEKQAEWMKAHPPEDTWGASQAALKAEKAKPKKK